MQAGYYREVAGSAALARFVECFWTHRAPAAFQWVLPDACIDIVFSNATGLQIAGTMTRALLVPAAGNVFVGVRFRPGMARGFLAVPASELSDKLLTLGDIWGTRGRVLEEQLRNTCAAEERLSLLHAALKAPAEISPIQKAIEFLAQRAGAVPLNEISRHAGLGERQLRRRCLEETGVTPKQLARIARFRRACSSIHSRTSPHWATLALECGYYDQAHLIREFQEFSGFTPADYVRQRSALLAS